LVRGGFFFGDGRFNGPAVFNGPLVVLGTAAPNFSEEFLGFRCAR